MNKFMTSDDVTFFESKSYFESESSVLEFVDDESMFFLLNPHYRLEHHP